MTVKTYLARHPEIKEFYLQSKYEFATFKRNEINFYGILANSKIKQIKEAPEEGELVTLHI